ncbi:MAG TPA: hypothetical protein VFP34_13445 [Microlunatus sp.]|nr:hypothetical protein [Microlunatus sp.]
MPESASQQGSASSWRVVIDRVRTTFWPPQAPDHVPSPGLTTEEDRLRRLDRVRDLLEQTRASLLQHGWTRGAWFDVADAQGRIRPVGAAEASTLLGPGRRVSGACVVGAMLRLVEDPDSAPSVADAWGCVDELHEAMHERMGHTSFPPGRIYSHDQRRVRLQALTAWNDESGRRLEDVLDLIDRAVARTMVGACRV